METTRYLLRQFIARKLSKKREMEQEYDSGISEEYDSQDCVTSASERDTKVVTRVLVPLLPKQESNEAPSEVIMIQDEEEQDNGYLAEGRGNEAPSEVITIKDEEEDYKEEERGDSDEAEGQCPSSEPGDSKEMLCEKEIVWRFTEDSYSACDPLSIKAELPHEAPSKLITIKYEEGRDNGAVAEGRGNEAPSEVISIKDKEQEDVAEGRRQYEDFWPEEDSLPLHHWEPQGEAPSPSPGPPPPPPEGRAAALWPPKKKKKMARLFGCSLCGRRYVYQYLLDRHNNTASHKRLVAMEGQLSGEMSQQSGPASYDAPPAPVGAGSSSGRGEPPDVGPATPPPAEVPPPAGVSESSWEQEREVPWPNYCSVCDKWFFTETLLGRHCLTLGHKQRVAGERRRAASSDSEVHHCTTCSLSFSSAAYRDRHHSPCRRQCKAPSKVRCATAIKPVRGVLSDAGLRHSSTKSYASKIRDNTNPNSCIYLNHCSQAHSGKEDFKCNYLNKTFAKEGNDWGTNKDGLQPTQNGTDISSGLTAYGMECSESSKGFNETYSGTSNLNNHERIQTGERPYKCDICYKAFTVASNLRRHKRIHTGERPYKCDSCNKAFSQTPALYRHKRIHTGELPHKCTTCNKTFPVSSDLRRHERIHTGERPYKCDSCNKAFSQTSVLYRHKRIHTGELPYKCSTCNKAFSQVSTLHKHDRIHTRNFNKSASPVRRSSLIQL